jgi:menaquinone-specific isochorismate synthase
MTAAPVPVPALRAATRERDVTDDLLDALGPAGVAWMHDGVGFVTSGVAARIEPAHAVDVLAAIPHDDAVGRSGTGPIAVGALPFDPEDTRSLVVPQRIVGRDGDGRGWITELEGALPSMPDRVDPADGVNPATPPGSDDATHDDMTRDEWCDAVRAALEAIARGTVEKVVLARSTSIHADRAFDLPRVLTRLAREQPGCFVFSVDGMVGASPELLVRRRGTRIESRPMAGTVAATDDAAVDSLRASAKDALEHRLVVEAIVETLRPICQRLLVGAEPEIVRLASVAHLATPIRGTLPDLAPDALQLARALHPTPAVGGTPTDAALELIDRLEPVGRGRYAGPVGWVDARGDGEWAVALRSAAIDGAHARLHAGAGIVAGSVPEDEWLETEAKLAPMLHALTVDDEPPARRTLDDARS